MNGFVTKYALTKGIVETELDISLQFPGLASARAMGIFAVFHGKGKDWHLDRESAVARAEQMRLNKIVGLRKQIKKLEALSFK